MDGLVILGAINLLAVLVIWTRRGIRAVEAELREMRVEQERFRAEVRRLTRGELEPEPNDHPVHDQPPVDVDLAVAKIVSR